MRIVHVAKFFPPCPGGIERFVADLSAAQAARGHAVTVVCFAHLDQDDAQLVESHGPHLTVIRVRTLVKFLFSPIAPDFFRVLQQALKRIDPDYLHIHVPNLALLPCLMTAYARHKPWVLHWHADVPRNARALGVRIGAWGYRLLEREALKRARLAIASSHAYVQSSEWLRELGARVRVIPLGLADEPPARAAAEPKHALFIGRFAYYKGLGTLIDALALAPDWRLTLVGDGPERARIAAQIERLGLSARVTLLGEVDDGEKRFGLSRAGVLVLPSIERTEAFGLVLLEAMRAGRAVIATTVDGSGMGEIVDDSVGWTVAPEDPAALAALLQSLTPDALAERGRAGRARFEARYRIARIAEALDAEVAGLGLAART
jgi:glycosyltransferase involved in cell wall biosynthesis